MNKHSRILKYGSAATIAMTMGALGAVAQETELAAVDQETVLDRVTVTARKREESLQATPVAVTALTEGVVERLQAEDLDGIEKLLPNVELSVNAYSFNTLNASIRGISFADLEKTFEPAVGVSIDGVFLAWNVGALFDLEDIEQIEVLRGPQGTLYGRNTTAGTINIRRTKPTGELGLKSRVRIGSHDQLDFNAIFNAPIIEDTLAMKLTYNRQSNENFQKDIYTGESYDGQDVNTFGAAFLYTPNDDFEALLSLDYSEDDSNYPSPINRSEPGELFCDLGVAFGEPTACGTGSYDISAAQEFEISTAALPQTNVGETFAATLEMNWNVASGTVTSVTGYRTIDEQLTLENSGSAAFQVAPGFFVPLFVADRPQESSQFSQELRYASDWSGPFNFVAGAYAMLSDYDIFPATNEFGTGQVFILGAPTQSFVASQELTALALFGEATYDLTDKLRLTAGARISNEEKDFFIDTTLAATGAFTVEDSETWTEPTWRFILDYQFTDDLFGYASVSRGFRSGGFNGRGTSESSIGPYDPETVDSYEIGMRTEWFDNRLRLNPTAFFYEYKDKQEELLRGTGDGGTETTVFNAANMDIWGFELEALAQPNDILTLRAAIGTLDYEYSEFEAIDPRIGSPTEGELVDISDTAELRRAPELTVSVGGDLVLPTTLGDFIFTANYKHTADQVGTANLFETDPRATVGAQDIVDMSATLNIDKTATGWPMDVDVTLWGRDVFGDVGREGSGVSVADTWFFTNVFASKLFGVDIAVDF